jgi:hypothetical protein
VKKVGEVGKNKGDHAFCISSLGRISHLERPIKERESKRGPKQLETTGSID